MRPFFLFTSLSISLLAPAVARAQASSLVGTWRRISQLDSAGTTIQPPNPPAYTTFTADGQYSTIAIPAGRAKVQKPWSEMSREELLALVQRVNVHRGTYTTSGNTVTRTMVTNLDPLAEGEKITQSFRFTGDTALNSTSPASKAGARLVRVR